MKRVAKVPVLDRLFDDVETLAAELMDSGREPRQAGCVELVGGHTLRPGLLEHRYDLLLLGHCLPLGLIPRFLSTRSV